MGISEIFNDSSSLEGREVEEIRTKWASFLLSVVDNL